MQVISFVLQQENIINKQSRIEYLFFSLLFAAADLLIAQVIPEKIKILKYIIFFMPPVQLSAILYFGL